ncbi:MAG: outer membrane protein assembly factor BamA [Candidatus Omnitrophica bacterium]|nr:outer membrane protein assembly factor BamA [Candidatus Omnitrophota bacterium]
MKIKKILILAAILVISLSGAVRAQGAKRLVKEIEVINNKVVSQQSILSKLQTKQETEYSPVTLSDDIKRLYATGLFSDVSADILDMDNGVKVVFKVQEKPVLKEIKFRGNRRIKTRKLFKEIKIKKEEIFDKFKLKEDMENLKNLYAKKGYSLVEVKYDVEEKDNKVVVTIDVFEGERICIRKISFQGNDSYNDKRIMKLIKTKRKTWLNSGFFKKDVLAEDTDRIMGFYHFEGFIDVQVSTNITYHEKKPWMFIVFEIKEGKQYKVGNVDVYGNSVFSKEQLREGLKLFSKEIYTEGKLRADTAKIQSDYFDEGYIAASVKADTVLNSQTGNVDINYGVSEGEVAYVDKINLSGNTRTKDVVLRREMRLFPGDRYNGDKLRRSRQRIQNLGFFEEVTFDTKEEITTLPDKYDLDIFVKESKTGEFSFGAGYSSLDQFIGFINLSQKNFDLFNFPGFAGAGQTLGINMEIGSARKDYELTFIEPWFLGYPVSTGFSLYSRSRYWDKYDEKRTGGNVFLGREFGEYWMGRITYRYEGVRLSDMAGDTSADVAKEEGKNFISSLKTSVTYDTRDNKFNPSKGFYNILSCEYAGGILEGDKDFIKYETLNYKYLPLGQKAVLELGLRLGMVEAFDDSVYVPVYERFYAGGANTIRGYKERRVGPEGEFGDPIGGRLRGIFNAEYIYQLTPGLKWAFFYDNGNVWATHGDFVWGNLKLRSSIGSGIRVKTPLGPIKLDYGYALDPKEGDAAGRFHFSMSQQF